MPIYEFRCQDCGRISDFLILSVHEPLNPICKYCQSRRMSRLISRVRVLRSEESRLESLADPSRWGGLNENDPASVARWMKRMSREVGEDLSDEEIDQMVDETLEETKSGRDGAESDKPDMNTED